MIIHSSHSTRRLQLVLGVAVAMTFGADSLRAQESLRDTLTGANVEWIVGSWTGTNSQGRAVTVRYEWGLDGNALEIDLLQGGNAYEGMIVRRPTDGDLIEFGADNRGGITRSTWQIEEGRLISERVNTRPAGQVVRVAVVSRRVDGNTVVATVHSLSEAGQIGEDTLETVYLSRNSAAEDGD